MRNCFIEFCESYRTGTRTCEWPWGLLHSLLQTVAPGHSLSPPLQKARLSAGSCHPCPSGQNGGIHLATSTSGMERNVKIFCFSPCPRSLTVSMGPPPSGYSTLMKHICPAVLGEDRAECSGPSCVPCEQEQAMVKAGAGPTCCVHCPWALQASAGC